MEDSGIDSDLEDFLDVVSASIEVEVCEYDGKDCFHNAGEETVHD